MEREFRPVVPAGELANDRGVPPWALPVLMLQAILGAFVLMGAFLAPLIGGPDGYTFALMSLVVGTAAFGLAAWFSVRVRGWRAAAAWSAVVLPALAWIVLLQFM